MSEQKAERWGIYGGTFDPPHLGHVGAARAFLQAGALDRLLIVPDYLPPHKVYASDTSADDRLAMCRLAFQGLPRTEVSDAEIRRGGKSYTYLTLEQLRAPGRELVLLVGTDMLLTLDSWREPQRIFDAATVAYVRREQDATLDARIEQQLALYRQRYGARLLAVPVTVREVASRQLRAACAQGTEDALSQVPTAVADYIRERGLYREPV